MQLNHTHRCAKEGTVEGAIGKLARIAGNRPYDELNDNSSFNVRAMVSLAAPPPAASGDFVKFTGAMWVDGVGRIVPKRPLPVRTLVQRRPKAFETAAMKAEKSSHVLLNVVPYACARASIVSIHRSFEQYVQTDGKALESDSYKDGHIPGAVSDSEEQGGGMDEDSSDGTPNSPERSEAEELAEWKEPAFDSSTRACQPTSRGALGCVRARASLECTRVEGRRCSSRDTRGLRRPSRMSLVGGGSWV